MTGTGKFTVTWLAVLVLAVCGKLALDLLLEPSELYSLSPVAAE